MSFAVVQVSDPGLQNCFTQPELRRYKVQFDTSRDGPNPFLMPDDLRKNSERLGFKAELSDADIKKLLEQFDTEGVGGLTFEGYLRLQAALDSGSSYFSPLSKPRSHGASKDFMRSPIYSTCHVVNDSEKMAYVDHINTYLADDPHTKQLLPIGIAGSDFIDKLKSGILLCKLVNVAVPGTIDERAINIKAKLNAWEQNENITLCINSARAIGCQVASIGTQEVAEGREHLVVALVAQIVKLHLLSSVSFKAAKELTDAPRHADSDEEDDEQEPEKESAEQLLLRWMNHYLAKANFKKEVRNFANDLKDGEAYTNLLAQLVPEVCDLSPLEVEGMERAERMLQQAEKIGCRKFLQAKDVVEGNTNLNLAFVANLFNASRDGGLLVKKVEPTIQPVEDLAPQDEAEPATPTPISQMVKGGSSDDDSDDSDRSEDEGVVDKVQRMDLNESSKVQEQERKQQEEEKQKHEEEVLQQQEEEIKRQEAEREKEEDLKKEEQSRRAEEQKAAAEAQKKEWMKVAAQDSDDSDDNDSDDEDDKKEAERKAQELMVKDQQLREEQQKLEAQKKAEEHRKAEAAKKLQVKKVIDSSDDDSDDDSDEDDEVARKTAQVEQQKRKEEQEREARRKAEEDRKKREQEEQLKRLQQQKMEEERRKAQTAQEPQQLQQKVKRKSDDDESALLDEERMYRLWINSLGVSYPVHKLYQDLRDGYTLLEVLEKVKPGCVQWGKAHRPADPLESSPGKSWRGMYKKLENCQQVVDIGRRLNLSLVGIGSDDIAAGNRKFILAFLWQLLRLHTLRELQQLRHDHELSDNDILAWAVEIVQESQRKRKGPKPSGEPPRPRCNMPESFKDRTLASGIFLLELMSAVEPRVVNWAVVANGTSEEERAQNANYIISVARKLGCSTFLVTQDIVLVRPKVILMLMASIMAFHLQRTNNTNGFGSVTKSASRVSWSAANKATPSPVPKFNINLSLSPSPASVAGTSSVGPSSAAAAPAAGVTPTLSKDPPSSVRAMQRQFGGGVATSMHFEDVVKSLMGDSISPRQPKGTLARPSLPEPKTASSAAANESPRQSESTPPVHRFSNGLFGPTVGSSGGVGRKFTPSK